MFYYTHTNKIDMPLVISGLRCHNDLTVIIVQYSQNQISYQCLYIIWLPAVGTNTNYKQNIR
jgi:hypothetical protein